MFTLWLSVLCVRSKASLAPRVSLRLARTPRPARARRSRRLCATLVAAPVLFAHAFGPCHVTIVFQRTTLAVCMYVCMFACPVTLCVPSLLSSQLGNTIVHYAAQRGSYDLLSWLCEQDVRVFADCSSFAQVASTPNYSRQDCLQLALRGLHLECVQLLLFSTEMFCEEVCYSFFVVNRGKS